MRCRRCKTNAKQFKFLTVDRSHMSFKRTNKQLYLTRSYSTSPPAEGAAWGLLEDDDASSGYSERHTPIFFHPRNAGLQLSTDHDSCCKHIVDKNNHLHHTVRRSIGGVTHTRAKGRRIPKTEEELASELQEWPWEDPHREQPGW